MGHLDPHQSRALVPALPQRIVIDSECATVEELIAGYRPFFTLDSWFVPSTQLRSVGSIVTFAFQLADGSAVLRGVGRIVEIWYDPHNSFHSPGAWLTDLQATPGYEQVLGHLMASPTNHGSLAEGTGQLRIDVERRSTLSYGTAPLRRPAIG